MPNCLPTRLCLLRLEYAAAAWDPSSKKYISDIEQLQDRAVRLRDQQLRLLMRILAKEEHYSSRSEPCNKIMNQTTTTMTTRSQTRGIPATF